MMAPRLRVLASTDYVNLLWTVDTGGRIMTVIATGGYKGVEMRKLSTFSKAAKAAAAVSLTTGTIALTAVLTSGVGHAATPAVLQGHTCTVVATARHRHAVGHAGDTVCGLSGNDTLKAVGPGTVWLIAGPGRDKLIAARNSLANDVLLGGTGHDTVIVGDEGNDTFNDGTGTDTIDCGTTGTVTINSDDSQTDDDNQGDDNSQGQDSDSQGTCPEDGNVTEVDDGMS